MSTPTKAYMKHESRRIEEEYKGKSRPRPVKPSLVGMLALIWRLLFHKPVWTTENQDHHNVRFIHVNFSAWHFAGSDLLWAGLAIRLFQAMQMNFGKLQLVLYRVAQHNEEEEIKKKIVVEGPHHWRSKRICCCPLWFLVLLSLMVPIIILIFLLTFELPKHVGKPAAKVNGTTSQVSVLEGLVIASFGVPAANALRFVFLLGKNLIFNEELNIKRGLDNERVSSKLGFMSEVRKEMWFLSRFVEFMEVFESRRIRVVLRITNLDRCSPRKIVAVLDAINILLSDEESPFISVLAVDPEIIIQKVNFADGCFCKEDRAYALLNRIVTLAFTVPPLCDDSKLSIFHNLASSSKNLEDRNMSKDKYQTGGLKRTSLSDISGVEVLSGTKEAYPLINKAVALHVTEADIEHWVKRTLESNERKLSKYILDDAMSMRRVINSIRVTVIIMGVLKTELPQPDLIAAWVVLANQWPCRLSWIIQCVEDALQRAEIDHNEAVADHSKDLWNVFSESRAELYVMRAQIEDLLDQDGDPEMFERFLKVDFQFTIEDLKAFNVVTVNLNHSLKKELAQIRGTSRLKDSGWMRAFAPLPITSIINMDSEDICKELEKMEYPRKYSDIVKSNRISGSALVFGDPEDVKKLLNMTFGEWTTFRLRFLGLPQHLQLQPKNVHHPHKQLARPPLQDTHPHLATSTI
ncbi:NTPase KAP family P-loop domain-containing protein 1 isoform X2 [Dunckerocampus dactyliophorus]|uniref:NTPase KAP family P-loop domain-containing protein 1 isoform X2 n=1 Tax=Dunckerocampus dactyliophorus TaxID=161453 RepID=UPI002405353D|nr:NTPase KAP family P-loop domain-containing protein 1 isoform X2 [Dunckerocampus dactyliophorus]